jgi:uncharacterized OB-fold protein
MEESEAVLVEGRIKIPYRWPAGSVGGRFLSVLREQKRFEGLRCPKSQGTVTTWTRRPQAIFALVKLDGADTAILHRLIDVDEPRSGMRVVPVMEDDLVGFRPVDE